MKTAADSLVGIAGTLSLRHGPSSFKLARTGRPTESFTEHLHSAEAQRPHARQAAALPADNPGDSAKPSPASAKPISSARGPRSTTRTGPAQTPHPTVLAGPAGTSCEPESKAETESATNETDSAEPTTPTEGKREKGPPETELSQPAPQALLATPPVMIALTAVQPQRPLPTAGESTPMVERLAEAPPKHSIESSPEDSSSDREVRDKTSPAPRGERAGQSNPHEQQAKLAGNSGAAGRGRFQETLRPDKPSRDSLTATPANVAEQVTGTAAAKAMLPMTNTVAMEESAGPAVKNLPGATRALAGPAPHLLSRAETTRAAVHDSPVDPTVLPFSATTTLGSGPMPATLSLEASSDVPAVDHVTRATLEGVVHLRHTGAESVTVVVKPEGGTELLLRVEIRDGALSAQLHFEQGDHGVLDQHWPELQRRLAEQGVRLSRSDDAGMGANAEFAQSHRRSFGPDPDPLTNAAAPGTLKIPNRQTIPQRRVHGFETWA